MRSLWKEVWICNLRIYTHKTLDTCQQPSLPFPPLPKGQGVQHAQQGFPDRSSTPY